MPALTELQQTTANGLGMLGSAAVPFQSMPGEFRALYHLIGRTASHRCVCEPSQKYTGHVACYTALQPSTLLAGSCAEQWASSTTERSRNTSSSVTLTVHEGQVSPAHPVALFAPEALDAPQTLPRRWWRRKECCGLQHAYSACLHLM